MTIRSLHYASQHAAHGSLVTAHRRRDRLQLSAASTAAAAVAAQATNNRERSFRPWDTARYRLAEFYWL